MGQRADEFTAFKRILVDNKVTSFLEVGSRYGDAFHDAMLALPKGSRGVAVDLGGGPWGHPHSVSALRKAVADLCKRGYAASMILGDSRSQAVIEQVRAEAPFDAVFIDGDHTYEGVAADWRNYGPLGRIVGFHDIDGTGQHSKQGLAVEVPLLWDELVKSHRCQELIGEKRGMGIGVVFREVAA